MKQIALEFSAPGVTQIVEIGPPPMPAPTEVLIETRFTGITNGTERHALMAEHFWGQFPSRHGYQHVGQITAVGARVDTYTLGDWVFYGEYVGHRGWNVVDVSRPALLIKLPADIRYDRYALLGVAGVAMKGVRRFGIKPADRVLVTGIGPIGYFSAMAAKVHGADVTVSDTNICRLEIARVQGIPRCLSVNAPDYWRQLSSVGPFDYIIDGSGYSGLFDDIFRHGLLAHNGAVCPMAVRTQACFPWSLLHTTDGRIEVSCHFGCDDLRVLINCIQRGLIEPEAIVSHRPPISEAPDIYAVMRDKPSDLFGVIFHWD